MQIIDESEDDGVIARRFDLQVGDETVPGMHWIPTDAAPSTRRSASHTEASSTSCTATSRNSRSSSCGTWASASSPSTRPSTATGSSTRRRPRPPRAAAGQTPADAGPIDPKVVAAMAARATKHVDEWRALLDALQADERWAGGPFGWWGVSMGTTGGIPLVAAGRTVHAPRCSGSTPCHPANDSTPGGVDHHPDPVPQPGDDELMTREAALALGTRRFVREDDAHEPRLSRPGAALRARLERGCSSVATCSGRD